MSDLLKRVIATSTLSPIFGEAAIRRAFERAGVNCDTLTPDGVQKALPELQRVLESYLSAEVPAVMSKIKALR